MNHFPTQYSTLSTEALNHFLRDKYALEGITTKFLLRGVSDTYLILKNEEPIHIFKVYRNNHRSLDELRGEVELLQILRRGKARVAFPISDIHGNIIQSFQTGEGTRNGVLFSFAKGQSYKDLTDEQLKVVGYEMAFNHNLLEGLELSYGRLEYTLTTTLDHPLKILQRAFKEYHFPEGYQYLLEIARRSKKKLKSLETSNFSQGYCHYDYLPKNFHFTEENEFTLFDFDFAGKGYLVNDLMTLKAHYFLHTIYAGYTREKADHCFEIFVSAYREKRALSTDEIAAIPALGINFWIFYLAIQYQGYDDFSNHYFNINYLKNWVGWIEKWEKMYCADWD